ncbi:MAG TPA: antibiotic biosynthesis monooxygenase [Methanobacterium sp.]|nr:antibiotic biosynthesis monooxygenase [Methanobacterium sp.]
MEVITFVKGKVSDSKIEEFKRGYDTLKKEDKPYGFIASYLLQDSEIRDLYIIESVWKSPEALENMRKTDEPSAPALFKSVGSKPVIGIYNVVNTI